MNVSIMNLIFNINLLVLHISAEELPSLGDNVFNVIIARNSLHFISNIPKFYDDMKFLLRSHGIFVKISSPLFDLGWYILGVPKTHYKFFMIFQCLQRILKNRS